MKGYVCLFVLLLSGALLAQSIPNSEEAVLKTETAWLQAEQQRDIKTLQSIIAGDFVGSGPNGATIDKEMITSIPEGATPFKKTKLTNLSAKVFGFTAVVFGKLETTDPNDPPVMRFAMFYAKRDGQWQMIAAQLVPVRDEPESPGQ